jgi:hypothetical protein
MTLSQTFGSTGCTESGAISSTTGKFAKLPDFTLLSQRALYLLLKELYLFFGFPNCHFCTLQ